MAKRLRDVADITRMKVCGDGRRSSVENGRTPGALENVQPFTALGCQCISRTSPGLIVTCVAATVFDTRKLVLSAIRTVPLLVSREGGPPRGEPRPILADANSAGRRSTTDFCCGTYTAASDTATTLDVTPSHLGRIRSAKIRHHHVTAQQVPSIRCDSATGAHRSGVIQRNRCSSTRRDSATARQVLIDPA